MSNKITHVIFDLCGTILASEQLIDYIVELAESRGTPVPPEDYDKIQFIILNGTGDGKLIDLMYSIFKVKTRDECLALMDDIFTNGINRCDQLMPGVDKLIKHLNRHSIPIAVATNGTSSEFNDYTKVYGNYFEQYFNHWVCGGDDPDVERNKPDPQIYHVCAQRFPTPGPVSPESVLVIEDSITGITGAIESGMKTLFINDCRYGIDDLPLMTSKVTAIAANYNSFDPKSVGLPAYDE